MKGDNDKLTFEELFGGAQYLQELANWLAKDADGYDNAIKAAKDFAKQLDADVKAGKDLKYVSEAVEILVKAFKELVIARSDVGQQAAIFSTIAARETKITKAHAKSIASLKDSYYGWQAALEEAEMQLKILSTTSDDYKEKSTKLLGVIKDMRTNIREFNLMTGNVGLVSTEDKLRAQIANLQEEGQVMADLRQQITAFKAAQKGLAEGKFFSVEGIAQAEELRRKFEALDKNAEDYDTQLKKLISDTQKLVAAEKRIGKSFDLEKTALTGQGVSVSRTKSGQVTNVEVVDATKLSYEQLTAVYKLATEALRSYNAEQLQTDETAKKLIETQANTVAQLNKFDQATGKVARQWDGLRMQVTQVVRELPSIAISANTFFLAVSNNIPYLADEIRRARIENKELAKSGQKTIPIISRIGKAFFSWNTVLVLLLTVFSLWGREILDFISNLFAFNDAVNKASRAWGNMVDEVEKTNDGYGKAMANLERMVALWKELGSDEEKAKFLRMYKSEIDSLGLGIKNVTDAEKAFVTYTSQVKRAFEYRAQSAAATKLAEGKYNEMIKAYTRIRELAEKQAEVEPTIRKLAYYEFPDMFEAIKSGALYAEPYWDFLDKSIQNNIKDIDRLQKEASNYIDIANQLDKKEYDVLNEAGFSYKTVKDAERQKDLLAKINAAELDALKRKNEVEEALLEDGFAKNNRKIRSGYEEERKEIKKQVDKIVNVLNEDFGKNIMPELSSLLDTSGFKDTINSLLVFDSSDGNVKRLYEVLKLLGEVYDKQSSAEQVDLGKEWRAEQTRRAQAAKEAVQLQLDAVREGSEEEFELKKKLIWKEYAVEIAANKEKESNKRQDALAIYKKYLKQEEDLRNAYDRTLRERQIKQLELEIGSTAYGREASTKTEQKIELQRRQALADIEQSGLNAEEQEAKRLATEQYYDRLILQERIKLANQLVKVEKDLVSIETDLAQKNSAEKLRLLLEQNNLAEQSELNNAYLSATSEEEYAEMADHIIQKYKQLESFIKGDFAIKVLDDQQALAEAVFNIVEHTEQDITRFELEQEKERWTEQIRLAEAGMLDWSEAQIAAAKATVEGINNQLKKIEGIGGVLSRISEHGLLGLFDMTDEQYDAWKNYADFIGDQIDKIIDKYVELAQAAVDAQQQQVDAARTVYEAELETRANGYANNVETAKKELQLQKETLKEKQKRLEEAERYQRISDEASTASSLITAIAQLYKAYAGIPYVGLIIAAAAVTGLLGMFAAGRASAKAAASQNYGGGGFELLQGGSHASGNDIDLGVNNRHNRRMRAEGGESMAIFSRRATKRYSEVLPDLVASINKGNFEEQYSQSFVLPDEVKLGIGKERYVNLSKIESSLDQLTSQGAEQYSVMPDGTVIIKKGNVTKIIKK